MSNLAKAKKYIDKLLPPDKSLVTRDSWWSDMFEKFEHTCDDELIEDFWENFDIDDPSSSNELNINIHPDFLVLNSEDEKCESDPDFLVVQSEEEDSNMETVKNINQLIKYKNNNYELQLAKSSGVIGYSETRKLIDCLQDDVMRERKAKWKKTGLHQLLFSPQKKVNGHDKVNDWIAYNFSGTVSIRETRTVSYTHDSDSDSVNTAEYIRANKGKSNKNISGGSNKKCLIKKYCYVKEIESNRLVEMNSANIDFPIENYLKSNTENHRSDKKLKHKRLNSKIKFRRNHLRRYSNSSEDDVFYKRRKQNRIKNTSRNIVPQRFIRRTDSLSDTTNSDSDMDDRILKNIRKEIKNSVVVTPNSNVALSSLGENSNQKQELIVANTVAKPNGIVKPIDKTPQKCFEIKENVGKMAEPIVEFPCEGDLFVYNANKKPNNVIEITTSSDESEDDIMFMSREKRSRLTIGNRNELNDPVQCQALIPYSKNHDTDSSSTDDYLYKKR